MTVGTTSHIRAAPPKTKYATIQPSSTLLFTVPLSLAGAIDVRKHDHATFFFYF